MTYRWRALTAGPPGAVDQMKPDGTERSFLSVADVATGIVFRAPGLRLVAVHSPTGRPGALHRFADRVVSVDGCTSRSREVIAISTDPPVYVILHEDGTILVAGSPYAEILSNDPRADNQ